MIRLINHSETTAELYPYFDVSHGLVSVCIVKATWQYDLAGQLTPVSPPPSIVIQDNFYGFPNASSITHAQENMPLKQHTEILCYGTIYPKSQREKDMQVTLAVTFRDGDDWSKSLFVSGQRHWEKRGELYQVSEPNFLKPLPLRYEYAYGGIINGKRYAANPAGTGYLHGAPTKKTYLPQIEYDKFRVDDIDQQPPPAGLGPLPVAWCRAKVYQQIKKDLSLPNNRASMAPLDQCLKRHFKGGEVVHMTGLHREQATISIHIPKVQPHLTLSYHAGEHHVAMVCDTLILDTEQQQVSLLWRQRINSKTKYKSCLVQIEH